jgi:PAS domain S-box-containing protein
MLKLFLRLSWTIRAAVLYPFVAALWVVLAEFGEGNPLSQPIGDQIAIALFVFSSLCIAGALFFHELRPKTRVDRLLGSEVLGDGVWEFEIVKRRLIVSPTFSEMLGYSPKEGPRSMADWEAKIHPEDLSEFQQSFDKFLVAGVGSFSIEYRMLCKDGSCRWIHTRASARREAGIVTLFGLNQDVTVHKMAQADLQNSLELMRTVLARTPTGTLLVSNTGEIVLCNAAAADLLSPEAPFLDRHSLTGEEGDSRPLLKAALVECFAKNTSKEHEGDLEGFIGRKGWGRCRISPFTYLGTRHALVSIEDRTAEQRTLEHLQLLNAAITAAPSGIVIADSKGMILSANPAFETLTGYTAAETIGKSTRLLRSGRHPQEFYSSMWNTILRGEIWRGTMINRRKDGSFYEEMNTIAPILSPDGAVAYFVAIKNDVSHTARLEAQLNRAQRLESVGQLAAGVVHDLNNMLSPIVMGLGMLRMNHTDEESIKTLNMMESAAIRGAGVLRQILTFAKGADGERSLLMSKQILQETVDISRETFPKNISVHVEIADDAAQINANFTQVHQVVLNLAVNARDAMPSGGNLTFGTRVETVNVARAAMQVPPANAGTYLCVYVKDSGSGMSPAVLEHIFEPFYTTKARDKGSGLGLSTVFGIVRSHGGFIEVFSEIGVGSEFHVYFPIATAEAAAKVSTRPTTTFAPFGKNRRVLIVDDEMPVRSLLTRCFNTMGFVVTEATTGEAALATIRATPHEFALVITDVMMPGSGGASLIREIRKMNCDVPIIVQTASPLDVEMEGLDYDTILRKPFDLRVLVDTVRLLV